MNTQITEEFVEKQIENNISSDAEEINNKIIPKEEESNKPDITSLDARQQRFIHTYLTGQYKLSEIADLLGVHIGTVKKWVRKPQISAVIKEYQDDEHELVKTSLKALQLKAVNKMNDLIDSPIDGIAYQASKDILDRGGHKPQQQIKVDKTVFTYEQKMRELISDENIIDVESELME